MVLALPRSKTTPRGEQTELVVLPRAAARARCPVAALQAWLAAAAITEGPVLRPVSKGNRPLPRRLHPESVNVLVQAAVARAGIDPTRCVSRLGVRPGTLAGLPDAITSVFPDSCDTPMRPRRRGCGVGHREQRDGASIRPRATQTEITENPGLGRRRDPVYQKPAKAHQTAPPVTNHEPLICTHAQVFVYISAITRRCRPSRDDLAENGTRRDR